jgi:hypothetical protein
MCVWESASGWIKTCVVCYRHLSILQSVNEDGGVASGQVFRRCHLWQWGPRHRMSGEVIGTDTRWQSLLPPLFLSRPLSLAFRSSLCRSPSLAARVRCVRVPSGGGKRGGGGECTFEVSAWGWLRRPSRSSEELELKPAMTAVLPPITSASCSDHIHQMKYPHKAMSKSMFSTSLLLHRVVMQKAARLNDRAQI